ncbi:hypothetical protein AGMMS50267_10860 [Spirochaetia bacterium]|nr:hypothetical protein AGMMS50267_10860 [Spirochaetia bacterium]
MVAFNNEFDDFTTKKFENDSKIGILASVAGDGYPHLALISSLSVKSKKVLMWGQFSQGCVKAYLKDNPKTGFMVVLPDMYWWTGKALHTETVLKGADYEYFNNKPLFRYNSYFGFGAVHYEDLVDVSVGQKLPIPQVALGAIKSALMKGAAKRGGDTEPAIQKLPPYGMDLASNMGSLKFVAYVDSDGFPRIIPALQGTAVNANRMVFSTLPYGELLEKIPAGAKAAVYLANMDLESLLLQGRWSGMGKYGGHKGAVFEIDKVYNSMLPLGGYVYPPKELPNVYGDRD